MNQPIMRPAGESKRPITRRFPFSKERVAGVKVPATGRTFVYDAKTPHLCYMVTHKGSRSYRWYGRINGRPVKYTIDSAEKLTVDQAREEAEKITAGRRDGINPVEVKRETARLAEEQAKAAAADGLTFGQLFEWYETNYAKVHKSSWKNDRSLYDTHLKQWEKWPAKAVTQDGVEKIHAALKTDKKPVTGNRLLSMLSVMYNVAHKNTALNFDGINPTIGITRHKERSRDTWVKTPAQLKAFNDALEAEPSEIMKDLFTVTLKTGARRSNVLSMRWDEIDMLGKLWTIPAAKAKADENIDVPLTADVMAILERRKSNGLEWVFPSHSKTGHLMEPKKAWAALIKRAGIPGLHLHDLRRTYASWMGSQGVSAHTIKAMLGHKSIKTTEIYLKANIDQMRKAAESGATAMAAAVAPAKPAKGKGKAK